MYLIYFFNLYVFQLDDEEDDDANDDVIDLEASLPPFPSLPPVSPSSPHSMGEPANPILVNTSLEEDVAQPTPSTSSTKKPIQRRLLPSQVKVNTSLSSSAKKKKRLEQQEDQLLSSVCLFECIIITTLIK